MGVKFTIWIQRIYRNCSQLIHGSVQFKFNDLQQFDYLLAVLRYSQLQLPPFYVTTFNLFFRKYQLSSNDAKILYYCIPLLLMFVQTPSTVTAPFVKYKLLPVILPLLLPSYYYVSLYDVIIFADDRDERVNK